MPTTVVKQDDESYCIEPETLMTDVLQHKATLSGIKQTVYHMYKRELAREVNGNFQKSQAEQMWTFLLVLTFAVLVGSVVYNADSLKYFLDQWKELGLITFAFPIAIFIILKLSLVLRWVLYWLVLATCILFILNSFADNRDVAFWVFIGFVVIEIITIVAYMFSRLLYPQFMAYWAKNDPIQFWGIRPIPNREGSFTRKGFWREKRFSYLGEVNALNQPDGYGNWTSEWPMGELLSGFWKNGVPVGPFKAQEYRTGYSFSNLRIGVTATDLGGFRKSTFKRSKKILYGVASVECSTSGKFFNDLPRANLLVDPYAELSVVTPATMLENIVHIDDHETSCQTKINFKARRIVMTFDPIKGVSIDGYIPKSRSAKYGFSVQCIGDYVRQENPKLKHLEIEGWQKSVEKEVLLYVPGFNCTLEDACETLGQMLTLGNMPPRIKPIIFGWPGGTLFRYQKAITKAECAETSQDFCKVIEDLLKSGISKFHILCHSMGARVILESCVHYQKYFFGKRMTQYTQDAISSNRAILSSVSFMNPEASLSKFKSDAYEHLRQVCDLVTVYTNHKDVALLASELVFTREAMMGRRINEYVKDGFDGQPIILDVDIIDTTEMDANVHAARHSYFDLNKFVVDDVTDIICTGQRAEDRSHRLLNIKNNVYGFLSAPSSVVK